MIKNRFEIKHDESEDDVEKLNHRIHDKKKQIEILQEQLNSRLPKGRPWVEKDILDEIQSIGVLEDEAEWNLVESALLKQQTFMPHPILFHSSDDLIWFEHQRSHPKKLTILGEGSTASCNKRHCVRFKGFDEKYAFEISGDRRHLHLLRQALKDRMIYDSDTSKNTSALFLVRSAALMWKESKKNENRIVRRKKIKNKQGDHSQLPDGSLDLQSIPEFYNPELPWNRYQLFLHCTIETRFLSEEGTQLTIEEKRRPIVKSIQTSEKKIVELEAQGQPVKTQQDFRSRRLGTLRRIDSYSNNYERPSNPLYEGEPHILTSVALGSGGLVTVSIVDAASKKILECQGLKGLLGKNYQLVQRRQFQRQLNLRRRTERQKRGANSQFGESNLGDTIDQHIANAVIQIAKKHHSGCIILPDMKDYRTQQHSKIAALAERECSGWKGVEKQFAKAQNMEIHSWSYGRLIKYIQNLAKKEEISVKIGRQPIDGTSQEQAKQMALGVYENKKHLTESVPRRSTG